MPKRRDHGIWMSGKLIQSILLDLDGTLVNTVPDITRAVNVMMKRLSLPDYSEEQVLKWVGNGTERLIEQALESVSKTLSTEDTFKRAYSTFMKAYEQGVSEQSHLYPGVKEGLSYLLESHYRLGCVTNKPKHLADSLLRDLDILNYFSVVIGGDSLPQKKPDPRVLTYAATCLDTPIQACLVIGDSNNDVSAARAAGMDVVCVTYGYNHGQDISESNPDAVISSLIDMRELLA